MDISSQPRATTALPLGTSPVPTEYGGGGGGGGSFLASVQVLTLLKRFALPLPVIEIPHLRTPLLITVVTELFRAPTVTKQNVAS
jgi:hypothetical protein